MTSRGMRDQQFFLSVKQKKERNKKMHLMLIGYRWWILSSHIVILCHLRWEKGEHQHPISAKLDDQDFGKQLALHMVPNNYGLCHFS